MTTADIINILHKEFYIDWEWVKKEMSEKEGLSGRTSSALSAELDACLYKAKKLADPGIVYALKDDVKVSGDSILIDNSISLKSRKVSSYIKGCDHLAVFVVTVGKGMETEASRMMDQKDELQGYLMDRLGSFAVESLAENFENILRNKYKDRNMSVSMRLSPGYCDWPIEEQFKLAKILDLSKIDMELTKNCMMVPKKSISGIIGVGKKDLYREKVSQCSMCGLKDCYLRRDS